MFVDEFHLKFLVVHHQSSPLSAEQQFQFFSPHEPSSRQRKKIIEIFFYTVEEQPKKKVFAPTSFYVLLLVRLSDAFFMFQCMFRGFFSPRSETSFPRSAPVIYYHEKNKGKIRKKALEELNAI